GEAAARRAAQVSAAAGCSVAGLCRSGGSVLSLGSWCGSLLLGCSSALGFGSHWVSGQPEPGLVLLERAAQGLGQHLETADFCDPGWAQRSRWAVAVGGILLGLAFGVALGVSACERAVLGCEVFRDLVTCATRASSVALLRCCSALILVQRALPGH